MQVIKTINDNEVLFTNETEYLPNVTAVSTRAVARVFGKEHKRVLRDFREAIAKAEELSTDQKRPLVNKGFAEGIDYKVFYEKNEVTEKDMPIMAISEKLFYQVALAYRGDVAFGIRKNFVDTFFSMKEEIAYQQEQIAKLEYRELLTHSNKSKGQNKRAKDKLKERAIEAEELLKQVTAFLAK